MSWFEVSDINHQEASSGNHKVPRSRKRGYSTFHRYDLPTGRSQGKNEAQFHPGKALDNRDTLLLPDENSNTRRKKTSSLVNPRTEVLE